MKNITVRKLMVPLEEYATVSQGADLHEAINALEAAQKAFDPSKHKHRAILVLDKDGNVVGKISMFDILMALEPKYEELDAAGALAHSGYNPEFIKALLKDNVLWNEPLQFACDRAAKLRVKEIMEVPEDGVYIDADATLDEAMHQLIVCRYHSLIVTSSGKVLGILRLADVFAQICEKIKTCKP
jgi:CBS domain-containing protein